jgi:hypothetical protein
MAVRPRLPPATCPSASNTSTDPAPTSTQPRIAARPAPRRKPRPAALLAAQLRWVQLRDELEEAREALRLLAAAANASEAAGTAAASRPNATDLATTLDALSSGALAAVADMAGLANGTAVAGHRARQQALQLQLEQALLAVGAAADPAGVGALVQRLEVSPAPACAQQGPAWAAGRLWQPPAQCPSSWPFSASPMPPPTSPFRPPTPPPPHPPTPPPPHPCTRPRTPSSAQRNQLEGQLLASRVAALLAQALNSTSALSAGTLLAAAAATSTLDANVSGKDTAQALGALQQGLQMVNDGAALRAQLMLGQPAASPACGPCCFFNEPDSRCVCLGASPCPLAWGLSGPALAALAGDARDAAAAA